MPTKPQRPCAQPGCPGLTSHPSNYCPEHLRASRHYQDSRRGTSTERGYNARWYRYTKAYLAEHPLCAICEQQGIVEQAEMVDHIIPHHGDPNLFWDPNNHQPLSLACHNRKTATQDGGYGKVLRVGGINP